MSNRLTTEIELSISCKRLKDMDVFSKSDPMVVVQLKSGDSQSFTEIGRTERIENNLNPDFAKRIPLEYRFEEFQQLRFDVYDIDNNSKSLSSQDFLGFALASVGQIVSTASGVLERPLLDANCQPGKLGSICVRSMPVSPCRESLVIEFSGHKLEKRDLFGKSDPFLSISKKVGNNQWVVVTRTEVIKKNLEPVWKPITILLRELTDLAPPSSEDAQVRIQCYDWNKSGDHELMGECYPTVALLRIQTTSFQLLNQSAKNKTKSRGHIMVRSCRSEETFSFMDFITSGGTSLNFVVAIDFTGSNGNPNELSSLHFHRPPERPSVYAQAILHVGRIVQDYDSDKLFPVYGFGATLPPQIASGTQHDFHVTLTSDPNCRGVEGILAAYSNCLPQVQLSGPTYFAPAINLARAMVASQPLNGSNYSVLLILTDGLINDMQATRDAIVAASVLPLSIIIVGVGNADFSAMDELDCDDGLLQNSSGQRAERDIVQFVQFGQFKSADALAAAVLAELPGQLVGWMKKHSIRPKTVQHSLK